MESLMNQNIHQDEDNKDTEEDQEELNSVIESISFGKTFTHKKLTFQAFSAAISHQDQVRFVKNYLSNVNNSVHQKFPSAKNKIIAYRVNQIDPLKQKEILAEGFDDDGETGAGEKVLGVLQKMEIENIMIIICIWNNGAQIGQNPLKGGELYRVLVDRAKELLNTIQEQILLNEMEQKKQHENDLLSQTHGKKRVVESKLYSMGAPEQSKQGLNLKPSVNTNAFKVAALSTTQRNRQSPSLRGGETTFQSAHNKSPDHTDEESPSRVQQMPDEIEQIIIKNFQEELTQQDMEEAQREVDESLRTLSKANLMELKQFSKPHPLVEKTLQIVCALRGFKQFNWSIAKEILSKPQFKMDLLQTKPRTLRPQEVLKAQQILNQKGNIALTPQNVHLHSEGAALLLVWAANIIKLFACSKKFGDLNDPILNPQLPLKLDEIQRISARTKIKVKKDIINKKQEEMEINIPSVVRDMNATGQMQPQIQLQQNNEHQSRQQQIQINQKSGTIGHFLQNKQMIFSEKGHQLEPEQKQEMSQQQLVDLSVIKKGAMNQVNSKSKNAQKKEEQVLKEEEDRMIQEEKQYQEQQKQAQKLQQQQLQQQQQKNLLQNRKQQQQRGQSERPAAKGGLSLEETLGSHGGIHEDDEGALYTTQDQQQVPTIQEDIPGKLKIHEVRDLTDDVDEIIGKLKGLDYGVQDLDVLIELAKTLKHKRLTLFPDTSNVLMSENFASYNAGGDNKD